MARFFREDFDRERDFCVLRAFVFEGKSHVPGGRLDKDRFSVRRLRQLYDMRNIGYFTGPVLVEDPKPDVSTSVPRRKSLPRYRPKVMNDVTA
jgi:hypothetical protein